MLHNGNRIKGHPRSDESIKLIREHLITIHEDKDENSLYVRFNELTDRIFELETALEIDWTSLVECFKEIKQLKEAKSE